MATGEGNVDAKFDSLNREIIETFDALFQVLEKRRQDLLSRLSSMKAAYDKNVSLEKAINQLRLVRENADAVMTSNFSGLEPVQAFVDTQIRERRAMKVSVEDVNLVEFRSFSERILECIEETNLIELIPEYVGRGNPILKKCPWGSGDGEIHNGRGVAFDEKTYEVYIVEQTNRRIQVFSTGGDFIRSFGHDQLIDGYGICLSENDVYVTDKVNFLMKFDKAGNFRKKAGRRGNKSGSFSTIAGLCYDDGLLYVSDASLQLIQIFDRELGFLNRFGFGVVKHPCDVKVHSSIIYALSQNENSIYCYTKDCQHLKTIQLKGQKESNTIYKFISIDCRGNFILSASSEIYILSHYGTLKHRLGGGHLLHVFGTALDNTNCILCVNSSRPDACFQKY